DALIYANRARMLGFNADMCFDDVKLGSMFKRAEKKGARVAVILGDNEVENGEVVIKNLMSKEQFNVPETMYEDKIIEILDGLEENEECCCGGHHGEGECCHGEGHHHEDGECCHHHKEGKKGE
ncbi:MAG: hypothetical protein K6F07_00600, partial [Bacilli bacterium]|nr:hypothetical protein [Bacilli bacterium]